MTPRNHNGFRDRLMRCSKLALIEFLIGELLGSDRNAERIEKIDLQMQLDHVSARLDLKIAEVQRLNKSDNVGSHMKWRFVSDEVDALFKKQERLMKKLYPGSIARRRAPAPRAACPPSGRK